ncbi:hypothetical protein D9M68_684270 [compost metagenome]
MGERASLKVASRRTRPPATAAPKPASETASTWPPMSALYSSAAPLKGMKLNFTPASAASRSIDTCEVPPRPVVPYDTSPGLALAAASSAFRSFHGASWRTVMPSVAAVTLAT